MHVEHVRILTESDVDLPHRYHRNCKRDKDIEAGEILDRYLNGPEERYEARWIPRQRILTCLRSQCRWFSGRLEITTMVVHPAYWNRGHASKLTKWCMALAEVDHTGIGVSATPMGHGLFQSMGFEEKEVVEVEGYEGHPESISLWIGVCDPRMADAKRVAS